MCGLRTQVFIAVYWKGEFLIISLQSCALSLVITSNLLHCRVWWKPPPSPASFTCRHLINHFFGKKRWAADWGKNKRETCQAQRHSARFPFERQIICLPPLRFEIFFSSSFVFSFSFFRASEGSAVPVKTFAEQRCPIAAGITSALLLPRQRPMFVLWLQDQSDSLDLTAFELGKLVLI